MIALLLLACAVEDPCADKHDLSQSPAGLTLTAEEHPSGWARSDCFVCHQRWEIHANDCVEGVSIDTAAIPEAQARDCVACHGDNGVAAWREEAP